MGIPGVIETEVNGAPLEIAYTTAGPNSRQTTSGYPLLYIHENGGSRHDFGGDYAESAMPKRRFVSFDLPGHGESSYSKKLDIYGLSEVVHDVMNVSNLNRVTEPSYVLVGHGLGALVALNYGLEHPDHVVGVVTIDGPFGSIAKSVRLPSGPPKGVPRVVFNKYSRLSAMHDVSDLILSPEIRSRLCVYGEGEAAKIDPDMLNRFTGAGIMHSQIPAACLNPPLENPTDFYKCLVAFLEQNKL